MRSWSLIRAGILNCFSLLLFLVLSSFKRFLRPKAILYIIRKVIYLSSKYNLQTCKLQGKSNSKLLYQSTKLDIKNGLDKSDKKRTDKGIEVKNEGTGVKEKIARSHVHARITRVRYARARFFCTPNRVLFAIIIFFNYLFLFPNFVYAGPQSTTYELKTYDFGGGGTAETNSTNYSVQGTAGSMDISKADSTNYSLGAGLTFANQSNVPAAPTFSNPATNYDRLKFIIDTGNNPSDAIFAIAISSDDFVTTYYVQDDNTIGTTLGAEDWQTYTNWGSGTGEFVRTLSANTTYKIKVKAKNGKYTESAYSATATAATTTPSLTFGISANSLTFSNLNSGNSYTDSSKSTTLTTSTNAYYGYSIYAHETQPLTSGANTITDYSSPNSTPTTWSGIGFGYTTDDNDLVGGTTNRFVGSKYAGFTTSAPGDPVADHSAVVESSAISSEQFTINYRVTATATTPAGSYQNKIIYVVIPTY